MGVIVKWLLLTGKYSCASDSTARWYGRHVVVIVRWLLYAGKYSCVSGGMVDMWLLL